MRTGWIALAAALLASGGQATARTAPAGNRPFRLCVLDQAAIVQRTRLAKDMGARFQRIRQQAQAKLDDDRRQLDADARALGSLRASLPAAVAKARDADIARRREQLKTKGDQINHNLAALDDQLTANIAKLSDPVVRAVEAEHGCSMLIGSGTILHLDDASLDITPAVIERMNAAPAPSEAPAGR
jgi:Skp family chaperone for outer membrane proteins